MALCFLLPVLGNLALIYPLYLPCKAALHTIQLHTVFKSLPIVPHLTPFAHRRGCLCSSPQGQGRLLKPPAASCFLTTEAWSAHGVLTWGIGRWGDGWSNGICPWTWRDSAGDRTLWKSSWTWVQSVVWCYTNISWYLFILWNVPEWKATKRVSKTSAQERYFNNTYIFFLCNKDT